MKDSTEEIFQRHFEKNFWGSPETVSGAGATVAYTESIRKGIPLLAKDLGIQSVFDAPCGDYNWFQHIKWESLVSYIGGDIVLPMIEKNKLLYGKKFIQFDIRYDTLPKVDLWICRASLYHLPEKDIMLVIDNFLKSDIKYLLTSTHPACSANTDISTGQFRGLNLQLPPYSFPAPLRIINDYISGFPVKQLALWERESLKEVLGK
jgi:hypothetical protein